MNGNYYNNGYNRETNDLYQEHYGNMIHSNNYTRGYDSEKYIDNILRMNIGKKVVVSTAMPTGTGMENKNFDGIVEDVGRDYLVISNPKNGEWSLILLIYITYITSVEPIKYN